MKIVLNGVETNNKGAELMFYAILQEIERRYPKATCFVEKGSVHQGLSYLRTSLLIKEKPVAVFEQLCKRLHLRRVMKVIFGRGVFDDIHYISGAKYFLDASGFFYSDKWNKPSEIFGQRKKLLRSHKRSRGGGKVVFLPQAFGPLSCENVKQGIIDLNKYADIVMPREKTSYDYLIDSELIDKAKLKLFPDFTCLVKGVIPNGYDHLHHGVCIIPNIRMLDKTELSFSMYNEFVQTIINTSLKNGFVPYLLNHDGPADGELAREFQSMSTYPIEVVDNLNALEVKGLISTARLVVTSRFHGAASSLNSCVPCLATSWSHKYEELFHDYKQDNCVLNVKNLYETEILVNSYLNSEFYTKKKNELSAIVTKQIEITKQMWRVVFE